MSRALGRTAMLRWLRELGRAAFCERHAHGFLVLRKRRRRGSIPGPEREPKVFALVPDHGGEPPYCLSVGRSSANDICLADPTISKRHAELRIDDDYSSELVDLESTNGTRIEGEKIPASTPTMLRCGQKVAIGKVFVGRYFTAAGLADHLESTAPVEDDDLLLDGDELEG